MSVETEIEDLSKSMAAAGEAGDVDEQLVKAILKIGPDSLKARLESCTQVEGVLIHEALLKAASFDKEARGSKYIQGKAYQDTIVEENVIDDDVDEKLVKPEGAIQYHQGTPSGAWDGTAIEDPKSKDSKGSKVDTRIVKKAEGEAAVEPAEVTLSKALSAPGVLDVFVTQSLAKGHTGDQIENLLLNKGLESQVVKDALLKAYKSDSYKGYGTETKKGHEDKDKDKEKATAAVIDLDAGGKDAGGEAAAEEVEKTYDDVKMKKSENEVEGEVIKKAVVWGDPYKLYRPGTMGRGATFSVNDFYDQALAKAQEGEAEKDKEADKDLLIKAGEPMDINDMIEKSEDSDFCDAQAEILNKARQDAMSPAPSPRSFSEEEFASAMGMSVDELAKLG